MTTEFAVRVIEQGNGLADVRFGAEVYDSEANELLVLTSAPGRIKTDDPRGNYVSAMAGIAERDVTDLTEAEFDALPEVKVVREID